MAAKDPDKHRQKNKKPEKAKVKNFDKVKFTGPGERDTLGHKVASRKFLGKKNLASVDGMPILYGPHAQTEKAPIVPRPWGSTDPAPQAINVSVLASASLAQRLRGVAADDDKELFAAYRGGARWDAQGLLAGLAPKLREHGRKHPQGLVTLASCWLLFLVVFRVCAPWLKFFRVRTL